MLELTASSTSIYQTKSRLATWISSSPVISGVTCDVHGYSQWICCSTRLSRLLLGIPLRQPLLEKPLSPFLILPSSQLFHCHNSLLECCNIFRGLIWPHTRSCQMLQDLWRINIAQCFLVTYGILSQSQSAQSWCFLSQNWPLRQVVSGCYANSLLRSLLVSLPCVHHSLNSDPYLATALAVLLRCGAQLLAGWALAPLLPKLYPCSSSSQLAAFAKFQQHDESSDSVCSLCSQ